MKNPIIYIVFILSVLSGCTKDFLDVNTDPNSPTDISVHQLLPSAERGLAAVLGYTNDARGARGISTVLSVYMHQIVVRETPDQYGATGSEFNINGSWKGMYSPQISQGSPDYVGCLQNTEILIQKSEAAGNLRYAGIGKIIKAYALSLMVDIYGDIPFTEANKFAEEGIKYPKFDKGEDIYPALLAMLDEAIADLNNTSAANTLVPSSNDLFYAGSTAKWEKAANTIKLKLYNQIRLTTDVSSEVQALLSSGKLMATTTDGLMFNYGTSISPEDRNPAYSDYPAGQKSNYISPWFYSTLKGYNAIFSGIEDPRIPFYFYQQLEPTEASQNTAEFRDGGFLSIYFGSVGRNRDWSQDQSMTLVGVYPAGGKYDDGGAEKIGATSGTGAAPLRLLTYADRLYIEAELINAGLANGDVEAVFNNAVAESFKLVDYVSSKAATTAPKLVGTAPATSYQEAIEMAFGEATPTKQLEMIMTQKWISSFGFSVDQYTDYRRTGYPILFDPNDPTMAPGGFVQPPINGNFETPGAQPLVPVQRSRDYPLSLPWPTDELLVNPSAPAQKTPSTYNVFWDN
ncbi:SusD-like starch-binding protein associating with outer membrane [Dyadobacter jejuensis]|uniref:SusD-like starch-binding protein associating with outer membrane n=1 Tax=Dyadobacter jejuensis TaxID=1082580 RepID=A0A316ANZ3_9BACT|nr:SusD/RagB family nutrient-binding outer membrane lipoprotein [Dyadobacter jejuensis]PWJ59211.1 SusD-like starch-binding protein associating with outer membrane [Dyadobacter jejuensis]